MSIKSVFSVAAVALGLLFVGSTTAEAGCVKKAARAYNSSKEDAKWYAMETIVQQVSWALWPAWVATGKIPGHTVISASYNCKKQGSEYNCYAQATICKK